MVPELQNILNATRPRELSKELNPILAGGLWGYPFDTPKDSYESTRAIIALLNNNLSEHDRKTIKRNIVGWIIRSRDFLRAELISANNYIAKVDSTSMFTSNEIDYIIDRIFSGRFDSLSMSAKTLVLPYLTNDFFTNYTDDYDINYNLFSVLKSFWNSKSSYFNKDFLSKESYKNIDALIQRFFNTNQIIDENNNLVNFSLDEISNLLDFIENANTNDKDYDKKFGIIFALTALTTRGHSWSCAITSELNSRILNISRTYNITGTPLNAKNYLNILKLNIPKFVYNIPGIFHTLISVSALELIANHTDDIDNLSFLESLHTYMLPKNFFTPNQIKNIQERINFLKGKNNMSELKFIYNSCKSVDDWYRQVEQNLYDLRAAPQKSPDVYKKIKVTYIGLLFDKHKVIGSPQFKQLTDCLSNFTSQPISNQIYQFIDLENYLVTGLLDKQEKDYIQIYTNICDSFGQDIIGYLPSNLSSKINSIISKHNNVTNNKNNQPKKSTNKGEKKMDTTETDVAFMDQMKEKGALALRRSTSRVVTKNVKRALLKVMEKKGQSSESIAMASALLDSEVGTAMVSMVLGLLMQNVPIPGFQDNDQIKKMASEFQVEGMSVGMEMVMGVVTDDLLPAITESLAPIQSLAAMEPEKSRVVANTNTPKVRAHVDEDHDEEHQETESVKRKSK